MLGTPGVLLVKLGSLKDVVYQQLTTDVGSLLHASGCSSKTDQGMRVTLQLSQQQPTVAKSGI